MPTPPADAFAALARSSPWRWSTLRFTDRRTRPGGRVPVRAWLRRPGALRVESLSGELLQIVRERPADPPAPVLRPDGLVEERACGLGYDAPMFQDYFWVAMLDPVELADGRDHETGEPADPALTVESLREVEQAGRPAWEAVVRSTEVYEPRCGCCPLLRTREIDVLEYGAPMMDEYPAAFRVRLDVGTGVCVLTEEIGGRTPGAGHEVTIEAVDEPMDDDLFVEPRRGLFRRR